MTHLVVIYAYTAGTKGSRDMGVESEAAAQDVVEVKRARERATTPGFRLFAWFSAGPVILLLSLGAWHQRSAIARDAGVLLEPAAAAT